MHRCRFLLVSVFAFVTLVIAVAASAASIQPLAETELPAAAEGPLLDFTGMDAFWAISDTLAAGNEPTEEQWRNLLDSPGYRALTQSEFQPEFFREAFTLALKPSRKADREALESGKLARVVRHVQRVVERKTELHEWERTLRSRGMAEIAAPALGLVPEHWAVDRPEIAFVIFDFDARGYDPIVVDLLASLEFDFEPFFAHEIHHWIRNRHLAFDRELADANDQALLWVLNQLQAEGIADLIDKRPVLDGSATPPPPQADYYRQYRANLEAAPDHLRRLDELLSTAAAEGDLPEGWAESVQATIPQSGHPTGYFMTLRIVDVVGKPALVRTVANPFAFVELYQRAAIADPEMAPPFSDQALTVIRNLGAKLTAGREEQVLENEWARAGSRNH